MGHVSRVFLLPLPLSLLIHSQTRNAVNWEPSPVPAVDAEEARNPSKYDWLEKNESWPDLSPGQLSTVLLAPCPPGVVPTEVDQYVYVENGSSSEAVMLASWSKPGTCRSGQASGTISFYTSKHHTAGLYAIKSASGGLQEALNAALFDFRGILGGARERKRRRFPHSSENGIHAATGKQTLDAEPDFDHCHGRHKTGVGAIPQLFRSGVCGNAPE